MTLDLESQAIDRFNRSDVMRVLKSTVPDSDAIVARENAENYLKLTLASMKQVRELLCDLSDDSKKLLVSELRSRRDNHV